MTRLLTTLWNNRDSFDETTFRQKTSALTRMVPLIISGEYKPKKSRLIIGVAAALYSVSPIDILPEIALGPIGLIDDFIILSFGLKKIDQELNDFLAWEERQKKYIDQIM